MLAVFSLIFLFLLVFAQTNTRGDTEPHRKVFLYHFSTVDDTVFGLPSRLYRLSPQNGEIQKFTYAQVCARDLRRAQWPWNCQDATVDKLDPSLPTVCYCFTDTSSLGLSDEDFTTEIGFLNFVYGARIPPFHFLILACEGFAPSTPSLSASPGWLLPSTLCVCRRIEGTLPQIFGLSLAEVRFYHPFSCMNSCHGAFTKSLAPIDSLSASLLQTFCKNPGHEGSLLATLHLTSKNGGFYLPFSASNCAIRCHILLGESPSCAHMGFYQQLYHLSVDCGGSIPPSEFWSWISSTLTLDGFHCPLRLTNWVSLRNLSLFTCHVVDLLSELLYLFTRKFSAISCMACSWLVFLTCIFLIDTCLRATSVHGSDDSTHESPLLYSTLALIRPSRLMLLFSFLLSCQLASCRLILVCVQLPYTDQTTPLRVLCSTLALIRPSRLLLVVSLTSIFLWHL